MNQRNIEFTFNLHTIQLDLPPEWDQYSDDDKTLLTFTRGPKALGALQISIATSDNNKSFDIGQFLKMNNISAKNGVKSYTTKGFHAYEYDIINEKNGMYIKTILFVKPNIIITTTYTSELNNLNKDELNDALKIIRTIKVAKNN